MEKFKKYLLDQLDKTTAWIGLIGLILLFVGWGSALFFLFVALIFLPETHFSEKFKQWTNLVKNFDKKL